MTPKEIIILGIESSCDDTSAAILKNNKKLSNFIANQSIHEEYGGVVPELASRAHQKNILPVIDTAIKKAGISKNDISAIAFTRGPGLLGSLLVGVSFAKSMAQGLDIPIIEVNHMMGHVLAHFIETPGEAFNPPSFPFLCLTVSGGHTQIVLIKSHLEMEVIGETIDDAAGEAFDKVSKILGLPYPGGPLIDKYAKDGNIHKYEFSIPKVDDLKFSFSGLKTQFLYFIQKEIRQNPNFVNENLSDICASIQHVIVTTLLKKVEKAVKQTGITEIAIAGGVSANSYLRSQLTELSKKNNWTVHIPKFEYCTDNAAMIGIVGYYKYLNEQFSDHSVTPLARMKV